jgi:hypothetical protein|tara:strand:+ start:441 stop:719 length:279 start_codon:yes stop_codon:yes gene_type:complete
MNAVELKQLQKKSADATKLAGEISGLKEQFMHLQRGNRLHIEMGEVRGGYANKEIAYAISDATLARAATQAVLQLIEEKILRLETKFRDMKS